MPVDGDAGMVGDLGAIAPLWRAVGMLRDEPEIPLRPLLKLCHLQLRASGDHGGLHAAGEGPFVLLPYLEHGGHETLFAFPQGLDPQAVQPRRVPGDDHCAALLGKAVQQGLLGLGQLAHAAQDDNLFAP